MANTKGSHRGGIRTWEDVERRAVVDDETECLNIRGAVKHGSTIVWVPAASDRAIRATAVFSHFFGDPGPGLKWIATCGNVGCFNRKHRKPGTHSEQMKLLRPRLDAVHIAKIAKTHQTRVPVKLTADVLAPVRAGEKSSKELAAELGIDYTTVLRAINGRGWREAPSVFSMGKVA